MFGSQIDTKSLHVNKVMTITAWSTFKSPKECTVAPTPSLLPLSTFLRISFGKQCFVDENKALESYIQWG